MNQTTRDRVPLSDEYATALGTATYCFAVCEWNVVWCGERINGGFLDRTVRDEMTAGQIARAFQNLVRNMPRSPDRDELQGLATEFLRLVEIRNGIVHGKPGTAPNGDQRLFSETVIDTTDLERAADAFAACSIALNAMLHGSLKA